MIHIEISLIKKEKTVKGMIFEQAEEISTIIELKDLEQDPERLYQHFMCFGDEVFYVLDNEKMYGIITLGDLYRTYLNKEKMPRINCDFVCAENTDDYVGAQVIFDKYPTIHEVAVVKEKKFLGVIKSGFRKNCYEWNDIRQSIQRVFLDFEIEVEEKKWIEKDIRQLLGIGCNIYIYTVGSVLKIWDCLTTTVWYMKKKENYYQ